MNLAQQFNSLHGTTVSRKTLEKLLAKAKKEKDTRISTRIIKVLKHNSDDTFLIEIKNLVKPYGLNAPRNKTTKQNAKRKKKVVKKPKSEKINPAIDKKKYPLSIIKKDLPLGSKVWVKDNGEILSTTPAIVMNHGYDNFVRVAEYPFEVEVSFGNGHREWLKPWAVELVKTIKKKSSSVKKTVKPKTKVETVKPLSNKESKTIQSLKSLGFSPASEVPEEAKDVFVLPGEIGKFLQKIQPHKALILIKGTKHTSKSQLAMQIANGLAESGKPVAYIDYEQGGMESKDTIDSINRNTTPAGRKLIAIKGFLEKPFEELKEYCNHCQSIVADSVTDLGITADQLNELRVNYPKVIWVFISQVKENGEMYGGNKMAHNPTAIIECHPSENPKERYATLVKNRGNDLSLKYSMYYKKLIKDKPTEKDNKTVKSTKVATSNNFSFIVN